MEARDNVAYMKATQSAQSKAMDAAKGRLAQPYHSNRADRRKQEALERRKEVGKNKFKGKLRVNV